MDEIVEHLRRGGLLGYPTETVYGLGGCAVPSVVQAIRSLKGREEGKPLLLLLPGASPMGESPARWGLTMTGDARRLADRFWPGPLTLVLRDEDGRFPPGIRSDAGGVAVRVSPHPFVEALMQVWDAPLISTSANRSGEAAAISADDVRESFTNVSGSEGLLVVQGGPTPLTTSSTLVDCTGARPILLREGAISRRELEGTVAGELNDER
jgi:L-threonylcarbamoyladenylate synthase